MAKPGMPEIIKTLGLTDVLTILRETNTKYATLIAQRTNNKATAIKDTSLAVCQRMDVLYDDMTTIAFVHVANPTAETATFVLSDGFVR